MAGVTNDGSAWVEVRSRGGKWSAHMGWQAAAFGHERSSAAASSPSLNCHSVALLSLCLFIRKAAGRSPGAVT